MTKKTTSAPITRRGTAGLAFACRLAIAAEPRIQAETEGTGGIWGNASGGHSGLLTIPLTRLASVSRRSPTIWSLEAEYTL